MNTIIQIPPSSKKDQTDAIKNQEYFPLLSFDITKHMWDLTTQRTAFKIVLVVRYHDRLQVVQLLFLQIVHFLNMFELHTIDKPSSIL